MINSSQFMKAVMKLDKLYVQKNKLYLINPNCLIPVGIDFKY